MSINLCYKERKIKVHVYCPTCGKTKESQDAKYCKACWNIKKTELYALK